MYTKTQQVFRVTPKFFRASREKTEFSCCAVFYVTVDTVNPHDQGSNWLFFEQIQTII